MLHHPWRSSQSLYLMMLCLSFLFFFLLFMAAPTAYGNSQARGRIELQLLACTTATAMRDLSRVWDLHHGSWQRWILNPLSEARDWAFILMDTSRIYFHRTPLGTPDGAVSFNISNLALFLVYLFLPLSSIWGKQDKKTCWRFYIFKFFCMSTSVPNFI